MSGKYFYIMLLAFGSIFALQDNLDVSYGLMLSPLDFISRNYATGYEATTAGMRKDNAREFLDLCKKKGYNCIILDMMSDDGRPLFHSSILSKLNYLSSWDYYICGAGVAKEKGFTVIGNLGLLQYKTESEIGNDPIAGLPLNKSNLTMILNESSLKSDIYNFAISNLSEEYYTDIRKMILTQKGMLVSSVVYSSADRFITEDFASYPESAEDFIRAYPFSDMAEGNVISAWAKGNEKPVWVNTSPYGRTGYGFSSVAMINTWIYRKIANNARGFFVKPGWVSTDKEWKELVKFKPSSAKAIMDKFPYSKDERAIANIVDLTSRKNRIEGTYALQFASSALDAAGYKPILSNEPVQKSEILYLILPNDSAQGNKSKLPDWLESSLKSGKKIILHFTGNPGKDKSWDAIYEITGKNNSSAESLSSSRWSHKSLNKAWTWKQGPLRINLDDWKKIIDENDCPVIAVKDNFIIINHPVPHLSLQYYLFISLQKKVIDKPATLFISYNDRIAVFNPIDYQKVELTLPRKLGNCVVFKRDREGKTSSTEKSSLVSITLEMDRHDLIVISEKK
ncbi:MAG: hypothetical protein JXA60_11685 [Candidatus Coatesbacteria bacterium]|nr:hypothetical protein [Candidatus Coatesbacteria bacterium]